MTSVIGCTDKKEKSAEINKGQVVRMQDVIGSAISINDRGLKFAK